MRTSPVHYIAPSAISIVPNANNSHRDIAVNIVSGTKIKVYCPKLGIGTSDTDFQEWTLTGRNRRLGDETGNVPYTIYARLPRWNRAGGYLVFASKDELHNWADIHSSVSVDGYSTLYLDQFGNPVRRMDINFFYIRLGDVSAAVNGLRTVTLDTGILGTQQWNNEWSLNPDALPLRIELGCTINDEDVGMSPYVYWDQQLVLTATITEGWTGTDIQRFDHWEISRKTDNDPHENRNWLEGDIRANTFSTSGEIILKHKRDEDDFNGAVATTFTIMAMEANPEYEEGSDLPPYLILKSSTITILAETIEKYELSLSESIVSYDPQTQNYAPSTGVNVGIRATDQRGEVFDMTRGQIANASLEAEYSSVGPTQWTKLSFTGEQQPATANIATTAFALQQSVNVRLMRRITADGQTAEKELSRTTIAFVRNGEDSKIREWIYRLNSNAGYDATTGTAGGTAVSGQTDGVDNCLLVDDFVPSGWSDDPTGVSKPGDVEWESWRDYDDENHRWGTFHAPVIHNRYAEDVVAYDIVPSVNTINAAGDGTVSTESIEVDAYKTVGTERTNLNLARPVTIDDGGSIAPHYYAEYRIDNGPWSECSAWDESTIIEQQTVLVRKYGIPSAIVSTVTDSIAFRLKHSSNTNEVLKEIPPVMVVRDGVKGDDAVTYDIVPSVSVINASSDGTVSTRAIEVAAYKTVGAERSNLNIDRPVPAYIGGGQSPHYYAEYCIDNGAWSECSAWNESSTTGQQTVLVRKYGIPSAIVSTVTDCVAFRLKHSSNTDVVLKETPPVKVVKDGSQGPNGHTGRYQYYAGVYNPESRYIIEASQAPYVMFSGPDNNNVTQTGFFMLDYKGDEPPYVNWPTDGHPTAPTFKTGDGIPWTPWTQMSSEHQYYIAKAFFGQNANLGSFIINGDWMISQYGTYKPDANTTIVVDDTNFSQYSTAYTHFKSDDPMATGSTYPCFAPNYAVDGRKGKTYQGDGYFKGEINATSGIFSGVLRKRKTVITADNIDQYAITSLDSGVTNVIDIIKTGTFLEFERLEGPVIFELPSFTFTPRDTGYTEDQLDEARSLIGNRIIIYNNSGYRVIIFAGNNRTIERGYMSSLVCKPYMNESDGHHYEGVAWELEVNAEMATAD